MGDGGQMLLGVATIDQWARDVLRGLGVPVSDANIDTMKKWATQESGSANPAICAGRFNPLNTTETHFGTACQGGSQGNIAGYSSYQQGVQSIVWNLSHTTGAGYEKIIAALKQSDQLATFAAIDASSFGTHGLGPASVAGTAEAGAAGCATASGGTTDATLTAAQSSDCPEGNLIHLAMPGPIPNINFTRCNGRAWLGAAALVGGSLLVIVGLAVLGARSSAGKAALGVIPGGNLIGR